MVMRPPGERGNTPSIGEDTQVVGGAMEGGGWKVGGVR